MSAFVVSVRAFVADACRAADAAAQPAREDAYRANNLGVALLEQFDYEAAADVVPRRARASTRRWRTAA